MNDFDVIIIGAGAAGLMCAKTAAARGCSVLILDHAEKPGKKVLISGGGCCNFSNRYVEAAHYLSANPHFCKSALAQFNQYDFIEMVEQQGIAYHERDHGQLFCDGPSIQIVEMLQQACRTHAVSFNFNNLVQAINYEHNIYTIQTNHGIFQGKSLVIASGGLSIPKMGATAFGHKVALQFGLAIIEPQPGLVPFVFTGQERESLKQLAGISLDVSVSCNNHQFHEAMLFTHRGISGPAILQISSFWKPGESISINLLPKVDVANFLSTEKNNRPQTRLPTVLAELIPKRLVQHLIQSKHLTGTDIPLKSLDMHKIQLLSDCLHGWRLKPSSTEGYRTAEVTVGGVDTAALDSKTMQSKNSPGLYFIGEVMDVTGFLGGYNFQWAWSSGFCAGNHIPRQ